MSEKWWKTALPRSRGTTFSSTANPYPLLLLGSSPLPLGRDTTEYVVGGPVAKGGEEDGSSTPMPIPQKLTQPVHRAWVLPGGVLLRHIKLDNILLSLCFICNRWASNRSNHPIDHHWVAPNAVRLPARKAVSHGYKKLHRQKAPQM